MAKGFTLDDAIFQQKIRKMAKSLKVDEKEFVRQQGGLLLRDMAIVTPPYKQLSYKGANVGKPIDEAQGRKAIRHDMAALFIVPDDPAAFIRARDRFPGQVYGKGGKVIAAGVARSIEDMRRHHRRNSSRQTGRAYRLKYFQKMWVSLSMMSDYQQMLYAESGKAKAAVMTAAIKIDPNRRRGIPTWVKRHLGGGGRGRMTMLRKSWYAVFSARAFGIQHVARDSILNVLKRKRLSAMNLQLKRILKHNAKKAGL